MKRLKGFEIAELTDEKIVQRHNFYNGEIIVHGRHIGNPNSMSEERRRLINDAAEILLSGYRRISEEKKDIANK